MMNQDTKRHIDAARQVLVGVVPNPTLQIDQITSALLYKFMDDMDQASINAEGEATFFTGDLECYAWDKHLMDTRIGNQKRMDLYIEALDKFSEAEQLPELFREIFANAFLPYRSPETLGLFLREIDYFNYSHPEELGNAYEYLLSIMSSQGDAGQFRTPRHIIDFIVDVVNPTKDDKILDPACGTAGFLVSSYRHILEQHDGKGGPEALTYGDRENLKTNFEGYDIDPGMARIAKMNMYLHQFKTPQIHQYDTLSNDLNWGNKFDVILANPPFMSPKGGIKPHTKFGIQSNRSEVLFVDYIMSHLRLNGRAGIIVPEGIIFQSGTAYKQLRKNLVEGGLYAVVSLPSGVFQPYSGVKTNILFLDIEIAKQRDAILFMKIENDGFALGATRQPIDKNDLPTALDILNRWQVGEKSENKLALYVKKAKIADDREYNLTGNRYREAVDYSNVKWTMVELREVCNVYQPKTITSKQIKEEGIYKVFGANGIIGYFNEYNHEDAEVVITCRGATCGTVNFTEPRSWITGNAMVVKPKEHNLDKIYLFHLLKNTDLSSVISGAAQPQITGASLKPFKIPLPPLDVQEQIVAEINQHQRVIDGAKQVVQNWKPSFHIDPKWEKVELGGVSTVSSGNTAPQDKRLFIDGKYPFYRTSDVGAVHLSDNLKEVRDWLNDDGVRGLKLFRGGTILFPKSGASTFLNHRAIMGSDGYVSSHLAAITVRDRLGDKKYIYYILSQVDAKEITPDQAYPSLKISDISKIRIPLPPLEVQEQIVVEIELEKRAVDECKNLIRSRGKKIEAKIAEVWGEAT